MESEQAPSDTVDTSPSPKSPAGTVRVLSNGTPVDSRGRFLPGVKPATAIQGSEQGRQLRQRQVEQGAIAARRALAERAAEQGVQRSPAAAVGLLAGMSYDASLANLMDKPREGVEAGKFALRLAGMLPADDRQAAAVAAVVIQLAPEARDFVEGVWHED